nr:DnaD domain protein [Oscillospiraceae bacterium]
MAKIDYKVTLRGLSANPAFTEASGEELRTLLALMEMDGNAESEAALAKAAGISLPRCKSALAFWTEAGVIREDGGEPTVIEEFEERLMRGEIDETPAVEVAENIRNESLASMIDECAMLLGQACLSNGDVKNLTALNSQYGLSPEFIVTLAAHLAAKGGLTVRKLCNRAIRLADQGCDGVEALEEYIKNAEAGASAEWEYRRVLGIYGRNLSKSEKEYFKKWSEEYGYSAAIISEAYDIAISKGDSRHYIQYMDTILTDWHENNCKTVSECKARSEAKRAELAAEHTKKTASTKQSKSKPETPRYGNFDIDEAFAKALERSYGTEDRTD